MGETFPFVCVFKLKYLHKTMHLCDRHGRRDDVNTYVTVLMVLLYGYIGTCSNLLQFYWYMKNVVSCNMLFAMLFGMYISTCCTIGTPFINSVILRNIHTYIQRIVFAQQIQRDWMLRKKVEKALE